MDERPFAALFAILLFIASIALCMVSAPATHAGRFDYMHLIARDRDLLTAEQQHELVDNGYVTVTLAGQEYTFYNEPSMKPYLNEGGLM